MSMVEIVKHTSFLVNAHINLLQRKFGTIFIPKVCIYLRTEISKVSMISNNISEISVCIQFFIGMHVFFWTC